MSSATSSYAIARSYCFDTPEFMRTLSTKGSPFVAVELGGAEKQRSGMTHKVLAGTSELVRFKYEQRSTSKRPRLELRIDPIDLEWIGEPSSVLVHYPHGMVKCAARGGQVTMWINFVSERESFGISYCSVGAEKRKLEVEEASVRRYNYPVANSRYEICPPSRERTTAEEFIKQSAAFKRASEEAAIIEAKEKSVRGPLNLPGLNRNHDEPSK
jgi:hypothetical protein